MSEILKCAFFFHFGHIIADKNLMLLNSRYSRNTVIVKKVFYMSQVYKMLCDTDKLLLKLLVNFEFERFILPYNLTLTTRKKEDLFTVDSP